MTQSSPPTCSWRPGDSEALRIALSIPVTPAALAALGREMAQLQTHYPTGVCTAQQHLDALAELDQQLQGQAAVRAELEAERQGPLPTDAQALRPLLLQSFARRFGLQLRPPAPQDTLEGW